MTRWDEKIILTIDTSSILWRFKSDVNKPFKDGIIMNRKDTLISIREPHARTQWYKEDELEIIFKEGS